MAAELDKLFLVQQIDDRLIGKRREIEACERKLAERKAAIAASAARVEEIERARKQIVSDRAFAERRLTDLQEKLRDRRQRVGRVRTEKELRASQDEVAQIREEISAAETEVLTLMERVDAADAELAAARRELKENEEADHRSVEDERGRIEALRVEAQSIQAERDGATAAVSAGLLKKYDAVLSRRRGTAMVTVIDGRTCGGCHMQVPPQALIEIRKNQSVQVCANCQRILYVPSE